MVVDIKSTTPAGTPPQDFIPLNQQTQLNQQQNAQMQTAASSTDPSAILANLQALANLSKQTPTVPVGTGYQGSYNSVTFPYAAQSIPAPVNTAISLPPQTQPVNTAAYPSYPVQSFLQAGNQTQAAPTPVVNQASTLNVAPDTLQQQLQIVTTLRAQGIPQDQWEPILRMLIPSLNSTGNSTFPSNPPNLGLQGGLSEDKSRDQTGFDYTRSPPSRYARNPRSRSRSPPRWDRDRRREASPPRRRDSPVYGEYGNDRNGNRSDFGRRGGARGRGSDLRQRSPNRFRNRSPSPRRLDQGVPIPGPRPIKYDNSLGEGMIKG